MKPFSLSLFSVAIAILVFYCGCSKRIDLEAERSALLEADRAWAKAANESDYENIYRFWHADGIMLMAPDMRIKGVEEYEAFTRRSRQDPNFSIHWTVEGADVSNSADMGYTYGMGEITRSDEKGKPVQYRNPYLVVWKKTAEGQWQCVIEK